MGNFFTPRHNILLQNIDPKLTEAKTLIYNGVTYPTILHAFTAFCLEPRIGCEKTIFLNAIARLPCGTLWAIHDMLPWGDEEFKLSSKWNCMQAKEFLEQSSLRVHTREAAFQGLQMLYGKTITYNGCVYECQCYNEFFNESMTRILNTKHDKK